MSNRHDRRKASATYSKSKLKSSTLDRHFEQTLRRIRTEFGRSGEIHPRFECVTDAESFDVPAHWPVTVVRRVPPARRCGIAFVAGG